MACSPGRVKVEDASLSVVLEIKDVMVSEDITGEGSVALGGIFLTAVVPKEMVVGAIRL